MVRILIGSPVRTDVDTFRCYLESLSNLKIPEGAFVKHLFLIHDSPELYPLVASDEYFPWDCDETYKVDEHTHHWTPSLVSEVGKMRQWLLEYARSMEYDYYFMVDSDLILHPDTLCHLISQKKDLISELFWTRWTPDGDLLPNAWDFDAYKFNSAERLLEFSKAGVYKIGMAGACFLMSKKAIMSKVSYKPIYNVSFWGEDRAFCVRAACEGLDIWLDTHYPCRHLYRRADTEAYMKEKGEG